MNLCPRRTARLIATLCVPFVLAACDQERAAYMIDGNSDHALTLIRDVRYPWSDKAELSMVVAWFPDCQRAHPLKPQSVNSSKVELFAVDETNFALHQGKNWYAINVRNCSLAPADPPKDGQAGRLVGTYQKREGKLGFTAVPVEPPEGGSN